MRSIIMAIVVKGRSISKGCAEGEALVCREAIGFNFGIDTNNGVITEYNHELFGKSIKDKILLFPHGKGSTGGSYVVYQLGKNKTGPRAIINVTTETIIAVGAIMAGIPVIDSLEKNPYDLISDGDHVKVDADQGLVVIKK
jgi:predicted aconitase with swiveling domain